MAHGEEAPIRLWQVLAGDDAYAATQARESLILYYQPLVIGMSRKLKSKLPTWIIDEDLISYGQLGLIKAVDRYDYKQGPFSSFASTYVHGAILDELRSQDWAPRGLRRDQRLVAGAVSELRNSSDDSDRDPSHGQIAENLGWSSHRVASTLKKVDNAQPVHFDQLRVDPSMDFEEDFVDSEVSAKNMCEVFVRVYRTLPEVTQVILAHRYFLGETMSVVSEQVGLPSATVRQMHSDAVTLILREVTASIS